VVFACVFFPKFPPTFPYAWPAAEADPFFFFGLVDLTAFLVLQMHISAFEPGCLPHSLSPTPYNSFLGPPPPDFTRRNLLFSNALPVLSFPPPRSLFKFFFVPRQTLFFFFFKVS